jgi:hypothetical protein
MILEMFLVDWIARALRWLKTMSLGSAILPARLNNATLVVNGPAKRWKSLTRI